MNQTLANYTIAFHTVFSCLGCVNHFTADAVAPGMFLQSLEVHERRDMVASADNDSFLVWPVDGIALSCGVDKTVDSSHCAVTADQLSGRCNDNNNDHTNDNEATNWSTLVKFAGLICPKQGNELPLRPLT